MSIPAIPQNYYLQQGNLQAFLSWSIMAGATSYAIQRSLNGVDYTALGTSLVNNYLDTTVTENTLYYYRVASVNSDGTSSYTAGQGIIPTIAGKVSLGALRLAAQWRSDRVNSKFVTLPEWNFFLSQAAYELYDILITTYDDYSIADPIQFQTDGSTSAYPLPNGVLTFTGPTGNTFVAAPFYKLLGVDLGLQTAQNGWVTVKKFNFIDRNKYVYANTASTLYGVYNLSYRVMGGYINFIPIPSANQPLRLWYVPRLPVLLKDTDVLDGISGWSQYVIVRAAKYALDKEEADTSKLDAELLFLKTRIEEAASNRDAGQADTISDTRGQAGGGPFGGSGYPSGGW